MQRVMMRVRNDKAARGVMIVAALCALQGTLLGQAKVATVPTAQAPTTQSAVVPGGDGVVVDRVVAVVNGDLILESDVDEEKRFQAFQPFSNPDNKFDRQEAVQRMVDRTLILQQAKLQPDDAVTKDEATAQMEVLRKDVPACKQYHCETEAGWKKFVEAQGFSVAALTERWQQRMQVLKFIEVRFRMGIRITPQEIKDYYDKTLLPAYAKRNATAPKLEDISDRIQEILLQQQVSNLLADWLKTLRAQGTVRVMTASGEAS
jgi:peptidyl-prolyl cis-trans isomerase SurA